MRKVVSFLVVAAVFCSTVFTSCEPKVLPDNKVEIVSIALKSANNEFLKEDIVGVVDAAASTVTFTIPTSVEAKSFIPEFTLTEHDVLSQDGVNIKSGVDAINVENGAQLTVSDEYSAMNVSYQIVVLANDQKVEILSLAFNASDNELLSEDVAVEGIAQNMLVRVPGAAFMQTLTLSVAVGEGDVVFVNKEAVVDGKIAVDTKFPIDIEVKDEVANVSASYVLKVGKILEYEVSKLGVYTKEGSTMGYNLAMAVNPVDKAPYIMVDAQDPEASRKQFNVVKWNGAGFEVVGNPSFSAVSASASTPALNFTPSGDAYALYKGGNVSSTYTVHKLNGAQWTMLGEKEATSKVASAYIEPVKPFINSLGTPAIFFAGNTRNTDAYRTVNVSKFDGTAWSESVVGGVPAYDGSSAGMFYGYSTVVLNGANYALMNFNQFGFYVYQVNDDFTLTPIIENYIPSDDAYAIPGNAKLCTDGKDLYVFEGSQVGQKMSFYKVNVEKKTINEVGSAIPVAVSSSGSVSEYMNFAISADDGAIVVVREQEIDAVDKFTIAISDENAILGEFTVLSDSLPRGDAFVEYAGDNTFYVSLSCKDADGNCFVELYKVAYEADIIPE